MVFRINVGQKEAQRSQTGQRAMDRTQGAEQFRMGLGEKRAGRRDAMSRFWAELTDRKQARQQARADKFASMGLEHKFKEESREDWQGFQAGEAEKAREAQIEGREDIQEHESEEARKLREHDLGLQEDQQEFTKRRDRSYFGHAEEMAEDAHTRRLEEQAAQAQKNVGLSILQFGLDSITRGAEHRYQSRTMAESARWGMIGSLFDSLVQVDPSMRPYRDYGAQALLDNLVDQREQWSDAYTNAGTMPGAIDRMPTGEALRQLKDSGRYTDEDLDELSNDPDKLIAEFLGYLDAEIEALSGRVMQHRAENRTRLGPMATFLEKMAGSDLPGLSEMLDAMREGQAQPAPQQPDLNVEFPMLDPSMLDKIPAPPGPAWND